MPLKIQHTEIILYVKNQKESTFFYSQLLKKEPELNVPGMTEFILSNQCKLGLMPNESISKIISPTLPNPALAIGIPRCELYFLVDDFEKVYEDCKTNGFQIISPPEFRSWGDTAFYISDLDAHIIAIAKKGK